MMYLLGFFVLLVSSPISSYAEDVTETEMFSIVITPKMFNWTYQVFDNQYTFHPSILNKPDLPQWLHYVYSVRHHSGFIYGTPPYNQKDILIQVVALNREDYETRSLIIPVHVLKKDNIATYEVQLKIDNIDVEDLLDEHRIERLKDVFRKKLWRDSTISLYTTFMASAVELGARLPLRPNEGEGVVLKLGSYKPHSPELLQLQEEVRPLSKLSWCPRDFKRTTVERLFRDAGFNLDWCTFRLLETENPSIKTNINKKNSLKGNNELRNKIVHKDDGLKTADVDILLSNFQRWLPPTKNQVPQRSYVNEFTFTIIIPMLFMIILVSLLSLILCFHHEGMDDMEYRRFIENIFHICTEYIEARRSSRNISNTDSKVELAQYHSDTSGITVANTSNSASNLQNFLGDNVSNKSGLPSSPSSLTKPRSNPNLIVEYNRPQPPPYLGSNTNSLVLRHRQTVNEDLATKRNQARTLEESLQMLNEANIANRNYHVDNVIFPNRVLMSANLLISDSPEGNATDEDYVPIKPESELTLRRNNGMVNGNLNNGSIMKNIDDF